VKEVGVNVLLRNPVPAMNCLDPLILVHRKCLPF
jgi:hypothetical protein